jgi:hypothetical protein
MSADDFRGISICQSAPRPHLKLFSTLCERSRGLCQMCGGLDAGIYDLKSGTPLELCEMILRIENPDIVRQGE